MKVLQEWSVHIHTGFLYPLFHCPFQRSCRSIHSRSLMGEMHGMQICRIAFHTRGFRPIHCHSLMGDLHGMKICRISFHTLGCRPIHCHSVTGDLAQRSVGQHFTPVALWTCWAFGDNSFLCTWGSSMHYRISSPPGLYPLNASHTPLVLKTKNISRHCQMSLGRKKSSLV